MIRGPYWLRPAANARTIKRREIEALNRDAEINARGSYHRGRIDGAIEERRRLTALIEDAGTGIVYMQPKPEPRYRVPPPPGHVAPVYGYGAFYPDMLTVSDVEAVPYALDLTNGRTIRWWGWRQVS